MAEPARAGGRRTFGPVVLLGLATGALAAVAGHKDWVELSGSGLLGGVMGRLAGGIGDLGVPLAGALSLVLLAAWGVLLVTRGRVRRVMAGLALLAAVGYLVTVVYAGLKMTDRVESEAVAAGLHNIGAGLSGWFWAAAAAGVLALVASALTVALAPQWPEMGRRYDAPTGATAPEEGQEPRENLEIWTAIDEGHDPTRWRSE